MFKKVILSLVFVFLLVGWVCPLSHVLYDDQKGPSSSLLEVLTTFGIDHDGSWTSIVQQTQKQWLRDPRKERWELDPAEDRNPENTYALFSNLSMTQSLFPHSHGYEYGIVLGATVQVVRQRFWFLKQQWNQGIRFKELIILTGDRPLDATIENEAELLDPSRSPYPFRKGWRFEGELPTNETEMMKLVLDQLDLPQGWYSLPIIFIDTPCPKGKYRPDTADTFHHWLTLCPKPASSLIVSSQPFVGRQDSVARNYLPSSFTIETIGEGFTLDRLKNENRGTAILLDELARWIYEELSQSPRAIPSRRGSAPPIKH